MEFPSCSRIDPTTHSAAYLCDSSWQPEGSNDIMTLSTNQHLPLLEIPRLRMKSPPANHTL